MTHSMVRAVQPTLCCEELGIGIPGNLEKQNVIIQKDNYKKMAVPVAPCHITIQQVC
jgi:hypothetical protein